jgi:hypothetical protein
MGLILVSHSLFMHNAIFIALFQAVAYAEEAVNLLSRSEQPRVSGGRRRRSSHSDGGEGSGSPAATTATTVSEDPAELVNIINILAKKTQQLPDQIEL